MGGLVESVTRRRFLWLAALGAGTVALGGCESGPREQAPSATTFDTPSEGAGASGDGADSWSWWPPRRWWKACPR